MVVFPYTFTTEALFCIRLEVTEAVVMPDLGDLSAVKEEKMGTREVFQPGSTESLKAIKAILNDDDYRRKLAMTNYRQLVNYRWIK
jgi:hypothetical protein